MLRNAGFQIGRNQFPERRLNLYANARAALGAVNGQPSPLDDSCRFIADDDLQFRAADFDAEEVHQGSNTRTRYHRNAAFVITSVTVVVELAAAKNGRLAGTSRQADCLAMALGPRATGRVYPLPLLSSRR